jgi:hypothetical protein
MAMSAHCSSGRELLNPFSDRGWLFLLNPFFPSRPQAYFSTDSAYEITVTPNSGVLPPFGSPGIVARRCQGTAFNAAPKSSWCVRVGAIGGTHGT